MADFLSLWSGWAGLCGKQSRVHLLLPTHVGKTTLLHGADLGYSRSSAGFSYASEASGNRPFLTSKA